MVFWCIFGGVRGGGVPEDEEELEGSDMLHFQITLGQQHRVFYSFNPGAGSNVDLSHSWPSISSFETFFNQTRIGTTNPPHLYPN
jgi:hypothetical protein